MFLVVGTYIKPIEEVDALMEGHYEFLKKNLALGKIILAGRRNPRFGGVLLCNSASREELEGILSQDPFYQHKVMDYQIIEFLPTLYADELERLMF